MTKFRKARKNPCASDLILSELTEEVLETVGNFNIDYERKGPSPLKSRGKGKTPMTTNSRTNEIDGVAYVLNEIDSEL